MSANTKKIIGIDVGTTNISIVVVDIDTKKQTKNLTFPNCYGVGCEKSYYSLQNADLIAETVLKKTDEIFAEYDNIVSVGVTGQMHGMLYIDSNGNAVSPLATWQDGRGNCVCEDNLTYCQKIKEKTGENISSGFGFATHYYNTYNNLVPKQAVSFCSIMDYIVMKLCGLKETAIHSSIAASFGLYDAKTHKFKVEKIKALGIDNISIPDVTDDFLVVGKCKNVPVCVAIGDNQASFLGSVKNYDETILVNVGTGSQISMTLDEYCEFHGDTEIRPFIKGRYLVCGSALCGGFSYALLEKFFREYVKNATGVDVSQYETMNALAKKAYEKSDNTIKIETTFKGKRSQPDKRGAISHIDVNNFTSENIVLGFINGICQELYDIFADVDKTSKSIVVASGGGIQHNEIMQKVITEMFALPLKLSNATEEAAVGAALFAAYSSGELQKIQDMSLFINYK